MVQYIRSQPLPTAEDLPETDHQPVDNELQIHIPTLLHVILTYAWADRSDWFLGINIGLYHLLKRDGIGPDALLSLGVERFKGERLRLSYVVWEENDIVPQWALEIVSRTPGQEYGDKFETYAKIGILYYTIYNPYYWQRDGHDPFETYRLEDGTYVRQPGERIWMPEIGLAIGREYGTYLGYTREWLYWYDRQGQRYPAAETMLQKAEQASQQSQLQAQQARRQAEQERLRAQQAEQRADQAQQRAERLAELLRQQGIDPNTLG